MVFKIDFIDIREPIKDYAEQKEIKISRIQKMLAASFHYNLDIPTLIRFLGNNYTGEYRDVDSTMKILRDTNCNPRIINDLHRIFTVGCLNKMNAHSTHTNFRRFLKYGNHSSMDKDIGKTQKVMNKEDKNQFLIPLPNWLARFIRDLHVTPQGLIVKPEKNDRLVWDGSFIPNWNDTCINMMLSHAIFLYIHNILLFITVVIIIYIVCLINSVVLMFTSTAHCLGSRR